MVPVVYLYIYHFYSYEFCAYEKDMTMKSKKKGKRTTRFTLSAKEAAKEKHLHNTHFLLLLLLKYACMKTKKEIFLELVPKQHNSSIKHHKTHSKAFTMRHKQKKRDELCYGLFLLVVLVVLSRFCWLMCFAPSSILIFFFSFSFSGANFLFKVFLARLPPSTTYASSYFLHHLFLLVSV